MGKKEQKKFNIYLKAGIWGMLAEILVRAISFLATPIFSRILPMDVYGEVKTFESWLNILSPILALGLFTNIEIARYEFKERFKKYISSVLFLIVTVNGAVFCVAWLLMDPLCAILDFSPSMLMTAVLYCCFYSCILCVMRAQRILLDYKGAAALSLLATVPSLILSVGCSLWARDLENNQILDIRILSFYIPIIILGVIVVVLVFVKQRSFVNLKYWKYAIKVSVPLIMYQISLQVLTQSDRIMIKEMVSAEKAAIFSIGTTVIYIVEIIHRGMEAAWIPWLYKQLDDRRYQLVNKAMTGILAAFGVIFAYILLLGNEVVLIFGGNAYREAKWLLGPMLGGVIFQFFMLKLADIEKFYKKESYVGIISIAVAILNLVLNYIGIYFWGYRAASYTTMISYMAAVAIHLWLISRKIPEVKVSGASLYGICSGIAVIMIAGMGIYFVNTWIRMLVLFVFIVLTISAIVVIWKKFKLQRGERV